MALIEQMENQGSWLFKYRSTLPRIIFAIGIFLFFKNETNPENWIIGGTRYDLHYDLACLFISFIGFMIRVYTVGFTPVNTSGRNAKRQVADVLNTEGIYSIVRNPLYLGNFFMWLGIAMLTGDFWFTIAFILFYIIYYERIIFTEEQFLRKKFGAEYINWAAATPIIVPRFRSFKKCDSPFNWRKVLKQEKNGFTAMVLIFCAFDIFGELLQNQPDFNEVLLTTGILSIIIYGVLKFLKYNTSVLENTDNQTSASEAVV
jgi:protein-S-isoprenylcysteine O-methyltransferase Ste14